MRRLLAMFATATILSVAAGVGPVTPASPPTAPSNQYWSSGTYTTAISSPDLGAFPVWHAPGSGADFIRVPSGATSRGNLGWAREAAQSDFTMRADA